MDAYCKNCGKLYDRYVINQAKLCVDCTLLPGVAHNFDTRTGKMLNAFTQEWPANGDSGLLDAIRQIVREEIRQALADEDEEEREPDYKPRLITIDSKPRLWVKFERDGVLYAGEIPAVEEKWGSE